MAKRVFTLKELFNLQSEIQEILGQKLTILVRYRFSDLKKSIDEAVALANETKDELIKSLGTTDDKGTVNLKIYEDEAEKVVNPKFEEFLKEWNLVLATEKEITYTPINLETIENIQTEKPIEVLFKLLEGAHAEETKAKKEKTKR
jgi:hypothetical protein